MLLPLEWRPKRCCYKCLDEYVGQDNPVRFIGAFVDGLDLAAAGFIRVKPKLTGRPGYAPKDLLKLYVYGYLNRVRSSRRLEAETHRNIEVVWLLRHLKPDFKTIADFRRINHKAFRPIFRQFVLLCRQLDLFGRTDRGRWHPDQSGQQQGPQLHPRLADPVYRTRRCQARRLPAASRPE